MSAGDKTIFLCVANTLVAALIALKATQGTYGYKNQYAKNENQ